MTKRRVVVTGMGMLSPVGNSVNASWQALLAGQSGIDTISCFDTSAFTTRFAGNVKNFDVTEYMSSKDAKKMDLFIQYGVAAGIQALKDSGIELDKTDLTRFGVAVGSGIGGLGLIEKTTNRCWPAARVRCRPFLCPAPSSTWWPDTCLSCTVCVAPISPSPPPVLPVFITSAMQRG